MLVVAAVVVSMEGTDKNDKGGGVSSYETVDRVDVSLQRIRVRVL